jgi:hypothetical protein
MRSVAHDLVASPESSHPRRPGRIAARAAPELVYEALQT